MDRKASHCGGSRSCGTKRADWLRSQRQQSTCAREHTFPIRPEQTSGALQSRHQQPEFSGLCELGKQSKCQPHKDRKRERDILLFRESLSNRARMTGSCSCLAQLPHHNQNWSKLMTSVSTPPLKCTHLN